MAEIGLVHFLVVSSLVFGLGAAIVMTRRNAVAVLMGVELILNAAALNFVAFGRFLENKQRFLATTLFGTQLSVIVSTVTMTYALHKVVSPHRVELYLLGCMTPVLVIFIGVLGGTLAHGMLGLFVGPIVLAVAWELLMAWGREGQAAAIASASDGTRQETTA